MFASSVLKYTWVSPHLLVFYDSIWLRHMKLWGVVSPIRSYPKYSRHTPFPSSSPLLSWRRRIDNLGSPKTPIIVIWCGYWVSQSRDWSMMDFFNLVGAIGHFFPLFYQVRLKWLLFWHTRSKILFHDRRKFYFNFYFTKFPKICTFILTSLTKSCFILTH